MTIQPATISPPREVPATIERPRYVGRPAPDRYAGDDVQPPEIIEKMRIAGRIAAQAMRGAATAIKPGVTTDDLDQVVSDRPRRIPFNPRLSRLPEVLLHLCQ